MSTTTKTHVIADFAVTPLGADVSCSKYIAETQKILKESGLNYRLHAMGTNIEGKFDQVVDSIRKCIDHIHEMGVPRVETTVRFQTRTDKSVTMADSVHIKQDLLEKVQKE